MATSLARQLAALRTPASAPAIQDTAYCGPFLFTEANQDNCDFATLELNAGESLSKLCEIDVVFARFTRFLIEDRLDERLDSEVIEELLFLLSPYVLLRPAQWVLQLLITKHKVHYKYPEIFFFSLLPYYDYDIYSQGVAAIETVPGGASYPNWFPKFKQSCFPTTKLSLYRHIAADRGFLKLLSDLMLRLSKHVVAYPSLKVKRQSSLYVMAILGALENRRDLGEEQAMYILQVILNSLKSNNNDIVSMGQIILSYILPRVTFKEKTMTKISKSFKNCIKKSASVENLMLMVLMVRTQENLNTEKTVKLMISLEPALNTCVNMLGEDESVEGIIDNIMYTLALLLKQTLPEEDELYPSSTPETVKILSIVSWSAKKAPLSSESVVFIGEIAYKLMRAIHRTPVEDIIDKPQVEQVKFSCEKIMKIIHESYSAEYQRIAMDTDNVDIFFMGGNTLENRPAEGLVSAKKAIMNNKLIGHFMENLINFRPGSADRGVAKLVRKNRVDISAVLKVETGFLVEQIEKEGFENLLLNLLVTLPSFPMKDKAPVVKHLCAEVGFKNISNKIRLELILISFFLKEMKIIQNVIRGSYFSRESPLLSSVCALSDDNPDMIESVVEKIQIFLSNEVLTVFLQDTLLGNFLEIKVLLLMGLRARLENEDSLKLDKELLVKFMLKILKETKKTEKDEFEAGNFKENGKESKEMQKLLSSALKIGKISDKLILLVLHEMNFMSDISTAQQFMEALPVMIENGFKELAGSIEGLIKTSIPDEFEVLKLYLQVAKNSRMDKCKYLCLQRVGKLLEENNYLALMLQEQPENCLPPLLLTQIFSCNDSIKKIAFSLLKLLMKVTDETKLKPIISFLCAQKTEILSQEENIALLLKKSEVKESSLIVLLEQAILAPGNCMEGLIDLFTPLKSKNSVCRIAQYGSDLLGKGSFSSTVKLIIERFVKRIIKYISEKPCLQFFLEGTQSTESVEVAGLQTRLSTLLLEKSTSAKLWQDTNAKTLEGMLKQFIALSMETQTFQLIQLLTNLKLTVSMFLTQLNNIWNTQQDLVKIKVNEETGESGVWSQTLFLFEVLESFLPKEKFGEQKWELMIQPLFALLRKSTEGEVIESSYKLNLNLSILLKVFNLTPDLRLKQLSSKDLEPELLTNCIRKSSNPETRQLALRVLARCAMTSPEFVLQNSMTIFTFMGSHLLRMDSKHSYKIACEAIDVIVPAIQSACSTQIQRQKTSLDILNSFINAEEDVPEHRYTEFIYRLVRALGIDAYLWIAMVLSVKTRAKSKNRSHQTELTHRRLTDLLGRVTVSEGLGSLLRIIVNMRTDAPQLRQMFGVAIDRKEIGNDDWDVLRLSALLLLTHVFSTETFISKVGKELLGEEKEKIQELLHLIMESSILSLESYESFLSTVPNKLKTSIISQAERVLELILALVPFQLYIKIVGQLLDSQNSVIRKRAMEVIKTKLEEAESTSGVSTLLAPLVKLAVKEDKPQNQQIALLGIRQICKQVEDTSLLREPLEHLNPSFLTSIKNPSVLGAAVLALSDIISVAGIVGVPFVTGITSWLLTSLETLNESSEEEKDIRIVYSSLLVGLQKVLENFGGFINPFLDRLIMLTCKLNNHPLAGPRASVLMTSIGENISPHILLSRAKILLDKLWNEPEPVANLAGLIACNSKKLERGQLSSVSKQFIEFFTVALTYRTKQKPSEQTEKTEAEIISSFLTVTLRLCLEDFKPVFQQFINKQKLGDDATLITMFNLIERVGARLKNLFGFGVEFVLTEGTTIIRSQNRSTNVVAAVLRCITTVLSYNRVSCLSQTQFEELVAALISVYQEDDDLHQKLEEAIVVLSAATDDDTNWKHLNFTVLMSLRDPEASVRMKIIQLIRRFVTSRSDTYLVVLPDAVPFLSEILEDDDQDVENCCKELIQHMETTFGQNIETYFM